MYPECAGTVELALTRNFGLFGAARAIGLRMLIHSPLRKRRVGLKTVSRTQRAGAVQ